MASSSANTQPAARRDPTMPSVRAWLTGQTCRITPEAGLAGPDGDTHPDRRWLRCPGATAGSPMRKTHQLSQVRWYRETRLVSELAGRPEVAGRRWMARACRQIRGGRSQG
jgi:hypothetical protein